MLGKKYIKPKIVIRKIKLNFFFQDPEDWSVFFHPIPVMAYSSDFRLKSKIYNYNNPQILEKISKLNIVTFNWNNKQNISANQDIQIGMIAQEVSKIFPEMVSQNENKFLTLDYAKLTIFLLMAVQKLIEQNKHLKKLIAAH